MHEDYYFHIPQLDLTEQQRSTLYKRYLVSKITHKGYNRHTYEYLKTFHTGIDILKEIYPKKILDQIEKICEGFPDDKFNRSTS